MQLLRRGGRCGGCSGRGRGRRIFKLFVMLDGLRRTADNTRHDTNDRTDDQRHRGNRRCQYDRRSQGTHCTDRDTGGTGGDNFCHHTCARKARPCTDARCNACACRCNHSAYTVQDVKAFGIAVKNIAVDARDAGALELPLGAVLIVESAYDRIDIAACRGQHRHRNIFKRLGQRRRVGVGPEIFEFLQHLHPEYAVKIMTSLYFIFYIKSKVSGKKGGRR